MLEKNNTVYEEEYFLTLFVGAIGHCAIQGSIKAYFESFGKVSKVKIIVDWLTKQPKNCALVYFTSPESIDRVLSCSRHAIEGKLVRVELADRSKSGKKIAESADILLSRIDYSLNHCRVIEYFSSFGQITSCKFIESISFEGYFSKSAIFRFEKQISIQRIMNTGSVHTIDGYRVECSCTEHQPEAPAYSQAEHSASHRHTTFHDSDQRQSACVHDQHCSAGEYPSSARDAADTDVKPINVQPPDTSYLQQPHFPTTVKENLTNPYIGIPQFSVEESKKPQYTKTSNFQFALEYETDPLFEIFCNFEKVPRPPMPDIKSIPYVNLNLSKGKSYLDRNRYSKTKE